MTQPVKAGSAWNILVLVGYFALFCACLLMPAAGWRAYRSHVIGSRWLETPAQISKCSLDVDHPFSRDGGGTVYSLRCRLSYVYQSRQVETIVNTSSDRSVEIASQIQNWVSRHPPGARLGIRVNPSNPQEVAVASELPIHQFNTAREGATGAAISAGIAGLLIATGRALAARDIRRRR